MIKMTNLKKHYQNFSLACSLEVRPGCISGLIGQNGAGKSTTFKAILGLISIDGGDVTVLGKDSSHLSAKDKEKIGVVLSDSGFSGYLRIKDLVLILQKLYSKFDKDFFLKQVARFQLPLDKKIKDFSTGMKAKLKVLIAVSHDAKLLILDEPTSGLDVIARDELLEMLREYMEKEEDRAILISSHISSDLETLCDDLYMIDDGKIILHEDTDVLLSDYGVLKLREEQYKEMDKQYILRIKKESFGYRCLTDQKQFYVENYPQVVVERGTIDEVIMMMSRGKSI
ncbi:ABC transporter ATP-binding protein [Merdibacter massiliensis]|uniref:ABC transporter ATP-binding protein n=1 Tax=Merdibacter massiliensis TaxID=1871030 RepID=UPI00096A7707|nr:ABC transporter ATP-binding protein [Merdibacter massiliensis]